MSSQKLPYLALDVPVAPPPETDLGAVCFTCDEKWRPYILALLKTLLIDRTWESEAERATGEASLLVEQFLSGGDCSMDSGYVLIRDEKSQNTQGGTFTNGAWRTRDLTTEVVDTDSIASLASNQITLPAGTYRVKASAPAVIVAQHQTRLQDITNGATLVIGTSENISNVNTTTTRSFLRGRFTLTGATVLELQHRCASTRATNGFGIAGNFTTEIYSQIEFIKEP